MVLPSIWGQGALFSYSGTSGDKTIANSFDARLCSDSFSFRIMTDDVCTLTIKPSDVTDITFDVVMSDYIKAIVKGANDEYVIKVMFSDTDTITIYCEKDAEINLNFECEVSVKKTKKSVSYICKNGIFALAQNKKESGVTVVFCAGNNAGEKSSSKLGEDIGEIEASIFAKYNEIPEFRIPNEHIENLYYKCASVIMGSMYSGEGLIKSGYVSVEGDNGKALRPFYSTLCTLGLRHIMPQKARETLESVLSGVAADGFLSSEIKTTAKNNNLCPPTLAWCFWELYCVNGDCGMLENAYSGLKDYLHYILETRDINKNHLYEWQIGETEGDYGKESTMNNSPRFDDGVILDCVDFSSFMANEAKHMAKIATEIDKHGEALYWDVIFERIRNSVNDLLFDEDDKIYYDKAVVSNMFKKIKTSASFMPLFAGICENRHAMALLKLLNNEEKFNLRYGIPSVSKDSEDYSDDMCRGPMSIITGYMIAKGLESYEMHDKANEIKAKSLEAVMNEYFSDGVIYEFYSPDGSKRAANLKKKGHSTNFIMNQPVKNLRDFVPTAAIIIDMLLSKSKKLAGNK